MRYSVSPSIVGTAVVSVGQLAECLSAAYSEMAAEAASSEILES